MAATVLYFSGTGNCLWVARAIAAELDQSRVISVGRAMAGGIETDSDAIGLVFPVYWGGLPSIVRRVLASLRDFKQSYLFAVATHAGDPGKVLPQLTAELSNFGLELSAGYCLLMPSNYIIGFPAPSEGRVRSYLLNAAGIVPEIVRTVRSRMIHRTRQDFPAYAGTSRDYDRFIDGVGASDRNFSVDESCTECGLCRSLCPVRNIEMHDGRPTWRHHCEQCLACINWCPVKAIQYGKNTSRRGRYTNPHVTVEDMIRAV
jgi:Pyruvate/2-oxoacid:ferredoxin oxidoreductase delta subunit